jgi:hypothetical protein
MANEIRTKFDAVANFTITLSSLASAAARQSTIVANANSRNAAVIYLRIESGGTAPAAGTVYEVYLLRDDGVTTLRTDNAGPTDAAITIVNAQLIGTIVVTNNLNTYFTADFDTAPLGPLGPKWGIAVKNSTDQVLNATEGNHIKEYAYYLPEIQ